MRKNIAKQKLLAGQATFGTWLSLGDFYSARILSQMGWDWLTLDLEHSPVDWSEAAKIFATIADSGCVPLARVPQGEHHFIKRVLDAGAFGIVVPMVETVGQAKAAIAAAKYPPVGNRSVGGAMHAMSFATFAENYYQYANDEILVVLQTESPLGVRNAEEIYALPGCDAVFIGPNDLRAQMRRTDGSDPTPEEHEAMIQKVVDAGKLHGTPTGIHAMDPAEALRRAEQGMQFIAVGSDLAMLAKTSHDWLVRLRPEATDMKKRVTY